MSKMPICYFFQKFGECNNKDCQYMHVDESMKTRDCAWYDRGFCKHGELDNYEDFTDKSMTRITNRMSMCCRTSLS